MGKLVCKTIGKVRGIFGSSWLVDKKSIRRRPDVSLETKRGGANIARLMAKRAALKNHIQLTGAPAGWRLKASAAALLSALRKSRLVSAKATVFVSISCVAAPAMARLNARYRGKRAPTDVLSFEQGRIGAPRDVFFLGDLVLCVPVTRDQAAEHGHSVRDEAAVLLAHGLLHLLGFDHERSQREFARMARAEARLLRAAGFKVEAGLMARSKVKK